MKQIAERISRGYRAMVLGHPLVVLLAMAVVLGILGYSARNFKIDASAETLLLENDADLRYAREVSKRYGANDFLIVAMTPKDGNVLSKASLGRLARLQAELTALPRVESILSILDVPLLESPPVAFSELAKSVPTLRKGTVDKALARTELRDSAFHRSLLVSPDMTTTALIIYLKADTTYAGLIEARTALRDKAGGQGLSGDDSAALRRIHTQIDAHLTAFNQSNHKNILAVRATMDRYRDEADLYLGGVSMIADDMISFIKTDLRVFGIGVFILLVVMLGLIFRRLRWVVMPMLCCFLSVVAMMGVLAIFNWEVTVISSNFISLQLIITLATVVHLTVRYREFHAADPTADQRTLVAKTVQAKFVPCLYAALTTIAGFSSLLICDIKPVIHFGWMMSAGILMSLALVFVIFPAVSMLMAPPPPSAIGGSAPRFALTEVLAGFTERRGSWILVGTAVVAVLGTMGVSRLKVENSFIDYFKESTEIYQGMRLIDRKLGGTTPVDVIVRFPEVDLNAALPADAAAPSDEDADLDDLLEEDLLGEGAAEADPAQAWFLDERMRTIERVHAYLDGLPQTGKVLSFGTILAMAQKLNKGKALDGFDLALLYKKVPDEYRDLIISPFISIEDNEARFSVRIIDSLEGLQRDRLLKQIQSDLTGQLGLAPERVRLAGAMVLYNNMLQSLFTSQIKTIGMVAVALLIMFWILFRSFTLAWIALFPNVFAAGAVLGIMGWIGIPLDMMTITIAAISVGIAVDDTIHYIYRFREEVEADGDYIQAMHRCHGSIGHAMYYTTVVIIIGFSILVFSSFWPTIYFGIFTGLAMALALLAALTLLPQLMVVVKPFGPQREAS